MSLKKKVLYIAAFIIITAIIVVVCVECFGNSSPSDFDGTLVKTMIERRETLLVLFIKALFI